MKRLAIVLVLLCALSAEAAVQVTYESITVAAVSIGLTSTTVVPTQATQMKACSFRLETAQVRYRWDGTAPTASEGTLLEVGEVVNLTTAEDALRVRFIRTGGTSGTLKGGCWR